MGLLFVERLGRVQTMTRVRVKLNHRLALKEHLVDTTRVWLWQRVFKLGQYLLVCEKDCK